MRRAYRLRPAVQLESALRDFDPFTVEIVKDKLHAAADEMGVVLARTSMSPIVYEVLDFACGITDAARRSSRRRTG